MRFAWALHLSLINCRFETPVPSPAGRVWRLHFQSWGRPLIGTLLRNDSGLGAILQKEFRWITPAGPPEQHLSRHDPKPTGIE